MVRGITRRGVIGAVGIGGLVAAACAPAEDTLPGARPTASGSSGGAVGPGNTAVSVGAGQPTPKGSLVAALPNLGRGDALHAYSGGLTSKAYWDLLYDYVLGVTTDGDLMPMLATQWTMSSDGMSWRFQLRQGVKFHNGMDLTAEDVKASIELVTSANSTYSSKPSLVDVIDRVEVQDAYQFTIHTKKPSSQIGFLLSESEGLGIIPKAYVDQVGIGYFLEHPVGSGPARFVGRKVGDNVTVEALDKHWGRTSSVKTFTFLSVSEDSTRLAMLRAGQADIVAVPITLADQVRNAGLEVRLIPNVQGVWFNFGGLYPTGAPGGDPANPFRKKEVRQALNLSINRQELVQQFYQGTAQVSALPLIAPSHLGYDNTWKPYSYDPDGARRLLSQAGYPSGFSAPMSVFEISGAPELPQIGEALATYFAKVGVRIDIRPFSQDLTTSIQTTFPIPTMLYPGQLATYTDLGVRLRSYYGPQGWSAQVPELGQLFDQLDREADSSKRAGLFRTIGQHIIDEHLALPIANTSAAFGISRKVGSWSPIKAQPRLTKLSQVTSA
jgi:peptide/nickel transport system substrate-binding protein